MSDFLTIVRAVYSGLSWHKVAAEAITEHLSSQAYKIVIKRKSPCGKQSALDLQVVKERSHFGS